MSDAAPIVCRRAALREILPLRHAVLRPGLPIEAASFAGDDHAQTLHVGAFLGPEAVCCASFMPSAWEGAPAWQLRGMATRADLRSRGIGAAVLRFAEASLSAADIRRLLWCNARAEAAGFYEKQGWRRASELFEIAGVGPHHRMAKALAARD